MYMCSSLWALTAESSEELCHLTLSFLLRGKILVLVFKKTSSLCRTVLSLCTYLVVFIPLQS